MTSTTAAGPAEISAVAAWLRAPDRPPTGTVEFGGFTLEYVGPRALATTLELLFEHRVYDVDHLADPQFVIDGGAWLGLSVLRLRQLYPQARVLAFEPDPAIFAILRRNLERNDALDGVELVNAALSGTGGDLPFTATGTDAGSLVCSVRGTSITVPGRRLSEYVDGPVALLKLNIEGAEADVIAELGDRLAHVDQVLIEYHGFAELPQSLHRILAALDEHGMTYVVSHFNERNRACVPPLRLTTDYRYFLLIYGRRLPPKHA